MPNDLVKATDGGVAKVEELSTADIALAFCKECLGWRNAYCYNDFGYPFICESVSKDLAATKIPPWERHFHYTHIDKIMDFVRAWLMSNGLSPWLTGLMASSLGSYFLGTLDQAGLCRELMAICVKASRDGKDTLHDA